MDSALVSLVTFAVVTSVTPGPNNIMLTASGAAFGFARTLPQMAGVGLGFVALLAGTCLGLGALFRAEPALHAGLRVAGAAYRLYLAWRIATATAADGAGMGRPLGFVEAALFQVLNPKGWIIAVSAASAYMAVGGDPWRETARIVAVFAVVIWPCAVLWTSFGVAIGRLLATPRARAAFNLAMAAALVASVALIFV